MTMQKWEYSVIVWLANSSSNELRYLLSSTNTNQKITDKDFNISNYLNKYGQEGWEMYAVDGTHPVRWFYFKRPIYD